jgi:uncharacterized protein (TIGR00369 family)
MTEATRPELSPEEKAKILIDRLRTGFDNTPFVKLIGMKLTDAGFDGVKAEFDMKPDLVGNTFKQILHGGVIATALDMVGGFAGLIGGYQRMKADGIPSNERNLRMAKLGTIDMRIDYLRPGYGTYFVASAKLVRAGKKVLVTHMEFHNENQDLIAVGTGTYFY